MAYIKPGFLLRRVINPIAAKFGAATILAVRGRSSGTWRTVPVNVLELDGVSYLVASWGDTHWARNLRAAGGGELRRGRSAWPFTAVEVDPTERPPIIAAYRARFESRHGGPSAIHAVADLRRSSRLQAQRPALITLTPRSIPGRSRPPRLVLAQGRGDCRCQPATRPTSRLRAAISAGASAVLAESLKVGRHAGIAGAHRVAIQGRPCARPAAALRPGSRGVAAGEPASPSRQ